MTMPKISRNLATAAELNEYTASGAARKATFHRAAQRFLAKLAHELGLTRWEVRSNKSGMAGSGEVTLHGERCYVQLYESCVGRRGLSVLYRECNGMRDYVGKVNHHARVDELARDPEKAARFFATLRGWTQGHC